MSLESPNYFSNFKDRDRGISIPSTIKNLKKLHNLVLDRNRINYLPKELGECESLRMLHLRNDSSLLIHNLATSGRLSVTWGRLPVDEIMNQT